MTFAEAYEFLLDYSIEKVISYNKTISILESDKENCDGVTTMAICATIDLLRSDIESWETCVKLLEKEKNFHLRMLEKME